MVRLDKRLVLRINEIINTGATVSKLSHCVDIKIQMSHLYTPHSELGCDPRTN